MLSTIKNNEAKAEALYKGKLVLLGGRVHGKVEKDRFRMVPGNSDGQQISGAECRVNSNQKQALQDLVSRPITGLAAYTPGGSWVEIQGTVKGWSDIFVVTVEIKDCEILFHRGTYGRTIIPFEHPACRFVRGECTPLGAAKVSPELLRNKNMDSDSATATAEPAPGNDEISIEDAFLYQYWSKKANKLRVIDEMKQESEVVDAAIWTCADDDYPNVEEMDCLEIHIVIIVNDGTEMGRARELGQQFVETAGKEFQRDLGFLVFVQENSDKESLTYGVQCQTCDEITWRD